MTTVLCIGSVLWDVLGRAPSALRFGADVPGRIATRPGGVALNVAVALCRLGHDVPVLSSVGRDPSGEALVGEMARLGPQTAYLHRPEELPTDTYVAIESPEGLVAAVADARTLEAAGEAILTPLVDGRIGSPDAPYAGPVVLDGNLSADLLSRISTDPMLAQADLRVIPASPGKARRLTPFLSHPRATIYVNLEEACLLLGEGYETARSAAEALVAGGVARASVTDGARQAAFAGAFGSVETMPPTVDVTGITGAGDVFLAAHLSAELGGAGPDAAVTRAAEAAARYVSGLPI